MLAEFYQYRAFSVGQIEHVLLFLGTINHLHVPCYLRSEVFIIVNIIICYKMAEKVIG